MCFWIESGIMTFGKIGFIFEHIETYGYWLTEDGFMSYNFIHENCKEILNVTQKE